MDEVREATYKGVKYHVRVDKRETNYYHLRGPILVFSSQEEMLKHAIDIDLAAASDGTPKLTTLLRELGADRALFAVVFNPRAFDAEVAGKIAKGGDPVLKTLFRYWKAVDAVVLSLTFDRDATLAIGVKGRSADLPASARRFFDSLSKPSDLWRQVPDDALLAVGGRIDFAALAESLGEFVPAEGRQKLETGLVLFFADSLGERNIVKYALPLIGHDCVMWLTAPADPKNLFPEGMFALRVGKGDKEAPVDEAILGQIRFFAKVAALSSSSQSPTKPLRVKSGLFDEQKVDYLEGGLLPAGIRPAFGAERRLPSPRVRPGADRPLHGADENDSRRTGPTAARLYQGLARLPRSAPRRAGRLPRRERPARQAGRGAGAYRHGPVRAHVRRPP